MVIQSWREPSEVRLSLGGNGDIDSWFSGGYFFFLKAVFTSAVFLGLTAGVQRTHVRNFRQLWG